MRTLDQYLNYLQKAIKEENMEWSKRAVIEIFAEKLKETRRITWLYYLVKALYNLNLEKHMPSREELEQWLVFEVTK